MISNSVSELEKVDSISLAESFKKEDDLKSLVDETIHNDTKNLRCIICSGEFDRINKESKQDKSDKKLKAESKFKEDKAIIKNFLNKYFSDEVSELAEIALVPFLFFSGLIAVTYICSSISVALVFGLCFLVIPFCFGFFLPTAVSYTTSYIAENTKIK